MTYFSCGCGVRFNLSIEYATVRNTNQGVQYVKCPCCGELQDLFAIDCSDYWSSEFLKKFVEEISKRNKEDDYYEFEE